MTGRNTVFGYEDRSNKKIHADIDESRVKAPKMLERVKEELDAVVWAFHQRKSSKDESDKMEFKSERPGDGKKKLNFVSKKREELKSLFQKEKPHHQETHGWRYDINENTPVDEVRAPNVFGRAEEEIEAVFDIIYPNKNEADGSCSVSLEKERAGFGCSLGKGLEKICAPWGDDKKD